MHTQAISTKPRWLAFYDRAVACGAFQPAPAAREVPSNPDGPAETQRSFTGSIVALSATPPLATVSSLESLLGPLRRCPDWCGSRPRR
jgi:hypothetical protein